MGGRREPRKTVRVMKGEVGKVLKLRLASMLGEKSTVLPRTGIEKRGRWNGQKTSERYNQVLDKVSKDFNTRASKAT